MTENIYYLLKVNSLISPLVALVVQKFGGTSLADIAKIRNVAKIIAKHIDSGLKIVVVASAMNKDTNGIIELFKEAIPDYLMGNQNILKEYDSIISTGEQVSSGLLAAILNSMGYEARSLLSWQIPLRVDNSHSKAKIQDIQTDFLNELLSKGICPIIAGFQGVTFEGRQATLGRGGSDTTAIAIASALKAERCDIFTDVDGLYTSDPRIVKNARILKKVSYEEVLEMTSNGAKVLETRSVAIAMRYKMKTRILSTFNPEKTGTILTSYKEVMEKRLVTGITSDINSVQVFIIGVSNSPGTAAKVFGIINDAKIFVDIIAQSPSSTVAKECNDIVFTINSSDLGITQQALSTKKDEIGYQELIFDENVVKISVIGIGMKTNAGIAYTIFKTLASKNINVLTITTSEIRVSVVIHSDYAELALRTLHDEFELDKPDADNPILDSDIMQSNS